MVSLGDTSALAYRQPHQRFSPTMRNLLRACARAHGVNFAAGLLITIAATTYLAATSDRVHPGHVGHAHTNTPYWDAVVIAVVFFAGLMISGIVHEAAHFAAARRLTVPVTSVFARTGAAGVTFSTTDRGKRAVIAVAGCLLAVAAQLAVFAATFLVPIPHEYGTVAVLLRVCCLLFVLLQLKELLPFSEDGRALWQTRSEPRT